MCGDGPASDVGVACLRGADCYRVGCGRSRRGGSLMTSHRSKSWAPRALALAAVIGAASTGHGCAAFNNFVAATQAAGGLTPPTVVYQGATLVQAPSQRTLAAYYCPDVVPPPFGVVQGSALLCQGFFGARPNVAQMEVAFDLSFKVKNPNNIPLPLGDVLTAVTAFPAAANQRLGAACVHLCAPGAVGCNPQPDATSCQASSRDVRSLSDFQTAAVNFIITRGIAAATGQPLSFTAPQVSAASELDVTVRFSFGPGPLLETLRQLASQSVNELKAGRNVSFAIPFNTEGTVWFDGGSFGRLAVGYGPAAGTFVLPVEQLVPR